ncbi:calcium-binding protein [Acuticoccus kandeliae]|uniref:calcium-binding protein n=1 Tax=Acuticoccus kandeliae TaxID=2073160 RepID=UPI0013004092|nr:calcium-binding protein [Acuticoccus kandeliae]
MLIKDLSETAPDYIPREGWVEVSVAEVYLQHHDSTPPGYTDERLFHSDQWGAGGSITEWDLEYINDLERIPLDRITIPEGRPGVDDALDRVTDMVVDYAVEQGISEKRAQHIMDYRAGIYLELGEYIETQLTLARRYYAGKIELKHFSQKLIDAGDHFSRIFDTWGVTEIVPPKLRDYIEGLRYFISPEGDEVRAIGSMDDAVSPDGPDVLTGGTGDATVYDGVGDDVYIFGRDSTVVYAGRGENIYVNGHGGTVVDFTYYPGRIRVDLEKGTAGKSTLYDVHSVVGSPGDDTLLGTDLYSGIDGGDGDDFIRGGEKKDRLVGGDGDDTVKGLYGDDYLYGGNGNDLLRGDGSFDVLRGEGGDDTLFGGEKADTLEGGAGDDVLRGDASGDELIGGPGNDRLTGGPDADTFIFWAREGYDHITDFDPERDVIRLPKHQFSMSDLDFITLDDGDLLIRGPGLRIVLDDGAHLNPSSDWFFFFVDSAVV